MAEVTNLSCACGQVQLSIEHTPIIAATCYCNSCRSAGARLEAQQLAWPVLQSDGGTPYVLYRKDRVRFTAGTERLAEFRLSPEAPTRRVVATCCMSPVFVEFQSGHWLSLYSGLWPEATRPAPDLLTQTETLPEGTMPSGRVPRGRVATAGFYAKLLWAWIAMGFRTPKVAVPGKLAA